MFIFSFGNHLVTNDIEKQLRSKVEVQEYLGEIQTFAIDWSKSLTADTSEESVAEDSSLDYYRVEGSIADGYIEVEYVLDSDAEAVLRRAEILFDGGRRVPIKLDR